MISGLPRCDDRPSLRVPPAFNQPQTQMKKPHVLFAGCGLWCLTAAFVPTFASAADPAPAKEPKTIAVNHRNEQYDVNKDGKIDEQERAVMKADRAEKKRTRLLAKYDANKNGQLEPEEEAQHQADLAKRREQRAARKAAKEVEKQAAPADDEDDDEAEAPAKR